MGDHHHASRVGRRRRGAGGARGGGVVQDHRPVERPFWKTLKEPLHRLARCSLEYGSRASLSTHQGRRRKPGRVEPPPGFAPGFSRIPTGRVALYALVTDRDIRAGRESNPRELRGGSARRRLRTDVTPAVGPALRAEEAGLEPAVPLRERHLSGVLGRPDALSSRRQSAPVL